MENRARLVGYALCLIILGGLLALILYAQNGDVFRRNQVRVVFPSIGTLMQDDPVKMQGVEIGRVDKIEASDRGPVATLEFYHRMGFPKDTRFVNYNYSLFGARMVIMVPGQSKDRLDPREVQPGEFSNGVTETIHRVDELLRTVLEYKALSAGLEHGNDSMQSLPQLLNTKLYPALEAFSRFTDNLEALQDKSQADLGRAAAFTDDMNRMTQVLTSHSDSMISKATRAVDQVTLLTAQSEALLQSLEKILAACNDTSKAAGKLLSDRDIYDRTMSLTHALQDLLKATQKEGLADVIHFWRNVRIHLRQKP